MTTPQTAIAVIEDALTGVLQGVNVDSSEVLSRVLAALGGEPFCYMRFVDGKPDWAEDCIGGHPSDLIDNYPVATPDNKKPHYEARPLYLHPAPPIDLAAVRAVAVELRADNGYWSDRLLRAIGDAK